MDQALKKRCALCLNSHFKNAVVDNGKEFCCHGCFSVYQILSLKNELENFQEHPVFIQAKKSGLISNPELLDEIKSKQIGILEPDEEKIYLEIEEMWCPSCAEVIRLVLMQEKGVLSCVVDYATDFSVIKISKRYLNQQKIMQLIHSLGYKPKDLKDPDSQEKKSSLYLKFIVAAFCSLNVMMFSYPLYASYFEYDPMDYGKLFAYASFFMTIPVMTFSFYPILKRFLNALNVGIYGMETLVVIGVISSFLLSTYELLKGTSKVYFDSLTVIITFVLLGKLMESKAKFSLKDALVQLNFALPRKVRKKNKQGEMHFVPLKEVKKGDTIVVYQGEKIPLDGLVDEGEASIDESLMTGESLPIFKTKDSKVIQGSLVQVGRLSLKVTVENQESTLNRIIQMVEEGLKTKSTSKKLTDQIIQYFVPGVIGLALFGTAIAYLREGFDEAFVTGLSILLISCPCAIGIAAPLAESYLMSSLSKLGLLVRNRSVLTDLDKITLFVFDKTGTITEGVFKVISGLNSIKGEDLSVLKAMTSQSTHLVSVAIFENIQEKSCSIEHLEEIPGFGLKAYYGNDCYRLGSSQFLKLANLDILEKFQENVPYTKVYFSKNDQIISEIYLGDEIKDEAKDLINSLKPLKTVLLSGDAKGAVANVQEKIAFDASYAMQTPLMKKELIEEFVKEGHIVCMVGDGINDAPALTAANIGISVQRATDMTIQVSDILMTTPFLNRILEMKEKARFGNLILKQNLFWAFIYNLIGLTLALFGWLSPLFATFAMMASSLIVLYNAKRIT